MKQFLAVVLLVSLLACLTACEPDKVVRVEETLASSQQSEPSAPEENVQFKLEEEIEQSTEFSDGYAIVKPAKKEKNYIINKQGEVLAVIPAIVLNGDTENGVKASEFKDGKVLISDGSAKVFLTICDIEGNFYKAEDFSVTAFYPDAIADGYILTATTVKGEKAKIGVLGTDLEWVIDPSEELAEKIGFTKVAGAQKFANFYKNHIVYGKTASFDVRNGDILSATYSANGKNEKAKLSENWEIRGGVYYYKDGEKEIPKANLYKLRDLEYPYCTLQVKGARFMGGKAPVVMGDHNSQTKFSMINESGEMVFEPIDFGEHIKAILHDGKFILVFGVTEAKCYDMLGTVGGTFENIDIDNFSDFSFSDGVLTLEKLQLDEEGLVNRRYFYDKTFTPLF